MRFGYLAIGLALSVAFASDSLGQSKQPPTQSKPAAQAPAPDQRGTDQVPLAVKILPATDAHEQAEKAERDRVEKTVIDEKLAFETQRIADYTQRLALFTIFLFCAAVGQAALFVWQLLLIGESLNDAKKAANAASDGAKAAIEGNKINRENFIAMRRAWLSIEDVKLLHPTKFTDDGFTFRVSATIKHHGETPATSVWVDFESYFPEGNEISFPDAQGGFRNKLRGRPVQLGETLFTSDTFTVVEAWGDGMDKIKNAIKTRPSGERKFGFMIFVGVSYRVAGDQSVHITQYAFGHLNVLIDTEVPEGSGVELRREPFLAGEID